MSDQVETKTHKPNSQVLSREVPQESLPAFASGDVAMHVTQPVSPPLQRSLRFLPDLLSAPPSVHLAMYFPVLWERYGFTLFRRKDAIV